MCSPLSDPLRAQRGDWVDESSQESEFLEVRCPSSFTCVFLCPSKKQDGSTSPMYLSRSLPCFPYRALPFLPPFVRTDPVGVGRTGSFPRRHQGLEVGDLPKESRAQVMIIRRRHTVRAHFVTSVSVLYGSTGDSDYHLSVYFVLLHPPSPVYTFPIIPRLRSVWADRTSHL